MTLTRLSKQFPAEFVVSSHHDVHFTIENRHQRVLGFSVGPISTSSPSATRFVTSALPKKIKMSTAVTPNWRLQKRASSWGDFTVTPSNKLLHGLQSQCV